MWLGGEGRMLNNLQFDYPTSRDAIAFYVQNANRLPELSPGQLVRIPKSSATIQKTPRCSIGCCP